jgi:hypothetical protein
VHLGSTARVDIVAEVLSDQGKRTVGGEDGPDRGRDAVPDTAGS